MASPFIIKGIKSDKYKTNKYVNLNLYLLKILLNNFNVIIYIIKKAYLIKNLKAKVLANVNLIENKNFVINLKKRIVIIGYYENIIIPLAVIPRANDRLYKNIFSFKEIIVILKERVLVFVYYAGALLINKNFLFEPSFEYVYVYLVDASIS